MPPRQPRGPFITFAADLSAASALYYARGVRPKTQVAGSRSRIRPQGRSTSTIVPELPVGRFTPFLGFQASLTVDSWVWSRHLLLSIVSSNLAQVE